MKFSKDDYKLLLKYQKDPFLFIRDMWGLEPQEALHKHRDRWNKALKTNSTKGLRLKHFKVFMKGKHLTWQQTMVVNAVKKALNGEGDKKISIRSGHGVGKTMILSLLIIWALFVYKNSQIPCTAPTRDNLADVLWPEIKIWVDKMPDGFKQMFDITGDYVRMLGGEDDDNERPKWFARARTGRKENPEALAGVHSESMVMLVADEASGVEEEVFKKSVGALTSENWLMILISNPTRLTGTFFKSQMVADNGWQKLHFNSMESPVVNQEFVESQIKEYGIDSDEYRITVLGEFPDAEGVDDDGYVRLIQDRDVRFTTDGNINPIRLGVDPAATGGDTSAVVGRDAFKAKVLSINPKGTPKKDASIVDTLMTEHGIKDNCVFLDNFGVGANVSQELAMRGHRVNAMNVGEVRRTQDKKRFANPRAECYRRLRERLIAGGELVNNPRREELKMIYYKRNTNGKIQMMSKKEMRKKFGKSPDIVDSLAYTFLSPERETDYPGYVDENFEIDYSEEL